MKKIHSNIGQEEEEEEVFCIGPPLSCGKSYGLTKHKLAQNIFPVRSESDGGVRNCHMELIKGFFQNFVYVTGMCLILHSIYDYAHGRKKTRKQFEIHFRNWLKYNYPNYKIVELVIRPMMGRGSGVVIGHVTLEHNESKETIVLNIDFGLFIQEEGKLPKMVRRFWI